MSGGPVAAPGDPNGPRLWGASPGCAGAAGRSEELSGAAGAKAFLNDGRTSRMAHWDALRGPSLLSRTDSIGYNIRIVRSFRYSAGCLYALSFWPVVLKIQSSIRSSHRIAQEALTIDRYG